MSSGSSSSGPSPQSKVYTSSNFCSLGPRPLLMTGFIRRILTDYYSDANNIEHEVFRTRLWNSGLDTGILIEDVLVWRPELADKRLAILIRRNGWRSQRLSINDIAGITSEGFNQHFRAWVGSHTLFCMAKEGAEVELLAAETYRYLEHFGPVFRKYFALQKFEVGEVGQPAELAESAEHFTVPITIVYAWQDRWTLHQHTPKIKRIALSDLLP